MQVDFWNLALHPANQAQIPAEQNERGRKEVTGPPVKEVTGLTSHFL